LAPLNRWMRAWSDTPSVSLAGRTDPFCLVGDIPAEIASARRSLAGSIGGLPQRPKRQRRVALVRSISTCSLAHLKTLNGETGEVILGSGQRALAATPPFTRVVLCDHQTRTASRLESTLREAYSERDFVALAGDCDVEIPCYLKTSQWSGGDMRRCLRWSTSTARR
jgi:hypothetical protein